jgi:hypothetical protein
MNYTASELSCSIKSLTLSTKECVIFIVIPNDAAIEKILVDTLKDLQLDVQTPGNYKSIIRLRHRVNTSKGYGIRSRGVKVKT